MTDTLCVQTSGQRICVAEDTGAPCGLGAPCNYACLAGVSYCTNQCVTGADSPERVRVAKGVGMPPVRVCVKAEAPCSATNTSACIAATACDTSSSLVVSGCTLACSTGSDCPQRAAAFAPWICDATGICRRPPDVYGPLPNGARPAQYACDGSGQVVNVCNDAQHIDYEALDVPPAPALSCPSTMTRLGHRDRLVRGLVHLPGRLHLRPRCVALGSVNGTRIGLCMPAGQGQVGSPCALGEECSSATASASTSKSRRDCTADGVCPADRPPMPGGGGRRVNGQPFMQCE